MSINIEQIKNDYIKQNERFKYLIKTKEQMMQDMLNMDRLILKCSNGECNHKEYCMTPVLIKIKNFEETDNKVLYSLHFDISTIKHKACFNGTLMISLATDMFEYEQLIVKNNKSLEILI